MVAKGLWCLSFHLTLLVPISWCTNSPPPFFERNVSGSISVSNSTLERGRLPQELYHSKGCSSAELVLTCPSSNTLVIQNSTYSPGNPACSHTSSNKQPRNASSFNTNPKDLRLTLNRICSGLSTCSLDLPLDLPESSSWPPGGLLQAFYRCAVPPPPPLCGSRLVVERRGFLSSGSYPKYYSSGGGSCTLSLRAMPGQRLSLVFLDVHLRVGHGGDCLDYLLVSERGRVLRKICGELDREVRVLSESHELDVQIQTNGRSIHPRRGFLAEYWPVGCIQGLQNSNSFISFTNATHMTYACPQGMAFSPDMRVTSKTIRCNGFEWSQESYTCRMVIESLDGSPSILRGSLKLALLLILALLLGLLSLLVLFLLLKTGKQPGGPVVNSLYTGVSAPHSSGAHGPEEDDEDSSENSSSLQLHEGLDLCQLQKEELYLC